MLPQDLAKLFHQCPIGLPGIDTALYEKLIALHHQVIPPASPLRYWGLVASHHTYRGHPLLRCHNLGNAIAEYPWPVRLVNFGMDEPTTIVRVGTLSKPAPSASLLDRLTNSFLIFEYIPTPALAELMQPGLIIVPGNDPAPQHRQHTIIFPVDALPRFSRPALLHFLHRPVPFAIQHTDHWIPPGAVAGCPALHITLDLPLYLEPGWPVFITDEDRPLWGIVLQ